jgi:hopanoid biosynthesis associated RND transporter like protein HpnN
MLTHLLQRAVSQAARQPWRVLGLAMLLMVAAGAFAATHFNMSTDTSDMISSKTTWRQNEDSVSKAFPEANKGIAIVIDGRTPELAEDAAIRLAASLQEDKQNFVRAVRPDGGEFFDRNGLLFGTTDEVRQTTSKLIEAQPLLGGLAGDPSLRGIAKSLSTAASGAADDPSDPATAQLEQPLAGLHRAIVQELSGKAAFFSWQQLFSAGHGQLAAPLRKVVLAEPVYDFSDLQPGARAVAAIRNKAAVLGIDPAHGVVVGITGEVPLSDEEFGSIEENIGLVGVLMGISMLVALWFATRSIKTVAAITITIISGLIITLAGGLAAVGKLNLISIAFIPLFVGLGVDFGIQVCVRFNAERWAGAYVVEALEHAAAAIGKPILLAAGAICLALCAFLPTDYTGIAQLGIISGLGMVVALVLNVTLLPSLLVLLNPPVPATRVGFAAAAPLDRWLARNRRKVLWAFVLAMLVSIATLPLVKFDFNPLNLRDPNAPAMRMLRNLIADPERTPNTLAVLTANETAARQLAARLGKLPEVRDAITLESFLPQDQPAKLALIEDAALLLDPAINPFDLAPPSDDSSTLAALAQAAKDMRRLAGANTGPVGKEAGLLAGDFERLGQSSPEVRSRIEAMLVLPLAIMLDKLRLSLQASELTRATLPPGMSAEWIARDGRAMVQIVPQGDSANSAVLARFTAAVRSIAPDATGMPVATQEAARTVARSFIQAGVLALVLVSLLLFAVLRSLREVAFTLAPVVLSGFLTLGSCVAIGQPLNFANIIAFPLLFGVGVAFHIYFVMAWWHGERDLLQSSLARAVLFSALATGSAFGALWFSHHPGTASMGLILMISLVWTLICALIFEPALLGPSEKHDGSGGDGDMPIAEAPPMQHGNSH